MLCPTFKEKKPERKFEIREIHQPRQRIPKQEIPFPSRGDWLTMISRLQFTRWTPPTESGKALSTPKRKKHWKSLQRCQSQSRVFHQRHRTPESPSLSSNFVQKNAQKCVCSVTPSGPTTTTSSPSNLALHSAAQRCSPHIGILTHPPHRKTEKPDAHPTF